MFPESVDNLFADLPYGAFWRQISLFHSLPDILRIQYKVTRLWFSSSAHGLKSASWNSSRRFWNVGVKFETARYQILLRHKTEPSLELRKFAIYKSTVTIFFSVYFLSNILIYFYIFQKF